MALVDEQSIIETYSPEEKLSCKKYFEYQKLLQENPKFGYKKCAKLLGIKAGQVRWWHTKGPKKAVPLPLKTVEKLKTAGLIPFTEKHEQAATIFNILGTIFGDGGIDRNLNTMAFISGDKRDVDLWEEDLLKVFSFAIGKTNLIEGGEWGHSYNVRTFDRAVIRFFVALGAPVGNKVSTVYSLPSYIFDLPHNLKTAFLDGLFSSEIAVPKFRDRPKGRTGKFFSNFELGLSKIDALADEHKIFLGDLKKLCESIGLTLTPNLRNDKNTVRLRKDGHKSCCYRIFFQTYFDKVLYFSEKFKFRYSTGKRERFDKELEKAHVYKNTNIGRVSITI